MSNILLAGILLLAVVAVIFLLPRRRKRTSERRMGTSTAGPAQRELLLHIVIPPNGVCCDAARSIEASRFNKSGAPPLPLPDCSMKPTCHCRYQPVPERRVGERRQSHERRQVIRFQDDTRRAGSGRRSDDNAFHRDK